MKIKKENYPANIRVTESTHKALNLARIELGVPMSYLGDKIIRDFLQKHDSGEIAELIKDESD